MTSHAETARTHVVVLHGRRSPPDGDTSRARYFTRLMMLNIGM
jgi:hypothetical protein